MNIEKVVLKNLLRNESYTRRVLPFLQTEYFLEQDDKVLFNTIKEFIIKYNTQPSFDALTLDINSRNNLSDDVVKSIDKSLLDFKNDKEIGRAHV